MLSDRIGFVKGQDDLTVYIKASGKKDQRKLTIFKAWLIFWSIAGFIILSQLFFSFYTREEKLYMVIYLAFWGYFEYRMLKAYYFRKYGIETVYINNDKFMLRRDILSKQGKPKYYQANHKNPFHEVEDKSGSVNRSYYTSFWVVSGGTIGFANSGGENRLGLQLPKEDAQKLIRLMNAYVKAQPNPKKS
jgi:hypothetical protein